VGRENKGKATITLTTGDLATFAWPYEAVCKSCKTWYYSKKEKDPMIATRSRKLASLEEVAKKLELVKRRRLIECSPTSTEQLLHEAKQRELQLEQTILELNKKLDIVTFELTQLQQALTERQKTCESLYQKYKNNQFIITEVNQKCSILIEDNNVKTIKLQDLREIEKNLYKIQ
jgi:hypothetical protein